jgi:UDPglucose 6-dehydrogenase
MNITVFGTGYVGLVTGTCLAEVGNMVTCVDIDSAKIEGLKAGRVPIFEPGLEPMVLENARAGRLHFSTDAAAALDDVDIVFIAVGTPPDEDGSADLRHVLNVARTIGRHLEREVLVVNKSTVPVGTAERVRGAIAAALAERGAEIPFEVASNPEFLKEGDAVKDCMRPDRIIIGCESPRALNRLRALYAPFNRNHERIVSMDLRSAELTKYAANAMLATKISFMNEMANLAEHLGADIERVRIGIGSDPRIGFSFIYPGAGYGGSCFPKDVQALHRTAAERGFDARILQAVEDVNQRQKDRLHALLKRHFGELRGRRIALWGLAFKPNTDDMREAPSRRLLEQLWTEGASVAAYDPEAREEAHRLYGERADFELVDEPYAACEGADALVVVTEWKAFWSPDFRRLKRLLKQAVIFDGRNIYDPTLVEDEGLAYYGIGRGRSLHAQGAAHG